MRRREGVLRVPDTMLGVRVSVVLGALLLAGCGASDPDTPPPDDRCKGSPIDVYVVGLEKKTSSGMYTVRFISATPAPPERGDNTWTLEVHDASGSPLSGATVTVTPTMPLHGHGTDPAQPAGVDRGDGAYAVSPVNLFMPGAWKNVVRVERDGAADLAEFWFCVPR